ncbi:MAG: hypothetical protein E5Y69_12935, partial [Mesorhizobium sp.]
DELGLRTPTVDKPWSSEEFMAALDAAKASGKYEFALDLGMNDQAEWYSYAFSPFLQSFGGDIVDRSTYRTAEGALNGEAAQAFGKWWQSLFTGGYAPGTSEDPALVRPVTPGYVVQAKVFTKALADIANGADVADTLDAAVDEIDADIESNGGYGHR